MWSNLRERADRKMEERENIWKENVWYGRMTNIVIKSLLGNNWRIKMCAYVCVCVYTHTHTLLPDFCSIIHVLFIPSFFHFVLLFSGWFKSLILSLLASCLLPSSFSIPINNYKWPAFISLSHYLFYNSATLSPFPL